MGSASLCFLFTDVVVFVSELYNGTVELRDGTAEFKKETSGITDDVDEELDSFFDEMTGKDMEIGSFVSEKEPTTEPTEKLNFGQKFLKLFGIN